MIFEENINDVGGGPGYDVGGGPGYDVGGGPGYDFGGGLKILTALLA